MGGKFGRVMLICKQRMEDFMHGNKQTSIEGLGSFNARFCLCLQEKVITM